MRECWEIKTHISHHSPVQPCSGCTFNSGQLRNCALISAASLCFDVFSSIKRILAAVLQCAAPPQQTCQAHWRPSSLTTFFFYLKCSQYIVMIIFILWVSFRNITDHLLMTSACSSRNTRSLLEEMWTLVYVLTKLLIEHQSLFKYVSMKLSWFFTLHEAQCEFSQEEYLHIVQSVVSQL